MSPFELSAPCGRVAAFALGLTQLDRVYRRRRPTGNFIDESLRLLQIRVLTSASLESVPATGPVVIIANHPTGALDGLAAAHLVMQRRSDVRLLANHLLLRIPELRPHVIGVNAFSHNARETARGLREARRWLANGGALILFPAGSVSGKTVAGHPVDGDWWPGVLKLIEWTQATVVPAYIHAQNRRIFRFLGRFHPLLRTALLVRELLARRSSLVTMSFGRPIASARLSALVDVQARLAYLRARTYALALGQNPTPGPSRRLPHQSPPPLFRQRSARCRLTPCC